MRLKNFIREFSYKGFFLFLLAPFALLLNQLAYKLPWVVNTYYTNGLYRFVSLCLGKLSSLFPFSLAEFLVIAVIIVLLVLLGRLISSCLRKPLQRKEIILTFISRLAGLIGTAYFLFVLLCGLNYARPSYSQLAGLPIEPSSVEDLEKVCILLGQEASTLRDQQKGNPYYTLSAESPYTLSREIQEEFTAFGEENSLFKGYYSRPKPVLFSKVMSYLDITGVYFPFTFEGNINVHAPEYLLPATMLHELAHFKGFMKESDANFIAYLVGRESRNPDTAYSSIMLALVHSSNAYYKVAGPEAYSQLLAAFSPHLINDLARDIEYWKQFQTPVAQVSRKVNDSYLKSHGQSLGIQSYGQMVDLVLADFRMQGLL